MTTAGNLERDRVLPTADIATAFVMAGATIAAVNVGPAAAAEWLRDLADAIEAAENRLSRPTQ
jgi:hypothetical protein